MVDEHHPEEAVIKDIEATLGAYFPKFLEEHQLTRETFTLKRNDQTCRQTNRVQRQNRDFEVLPATDTISKMILEKRSAVDIENCSRGRHATDETRWVSQSLRRNNQLKRWYAAVQI